MRVFSTPIILVLSTFLSASLHALPAQLTSDMAALDKTYIPALGLSGQSAEMAGAKTAFRTFEKTWNDFRARYEAQEGFDARWREDLADVGQAVQVAGLALMEGADGPEAHEELEKVRMIFLASRTRQNIPYFLDYLTLFHNAMEELLSRAPHKRLADWNDAERSSFSATLDAATGRSNEVRSMETLLPQARLAPRAAANYLTQRQALDSVLEGIRTAFAAPDEEAFARALSQLKPAFVRTFFLFGDFPH